MLTPVTLELTKKSTRDKQQVQQTIDELVHQGHTLYLIDGNKVPHVYRDMKQIQLLYLRTQYVCITTEVIEHAVR